MDPAEWYASLPSFLASASALITNPAGSSVLCVKPNYRPWWNVPGGILEGGEAPHEACAREITEELGIHLDLGRLLVVDWVAPNSQRKAWFGFVFDGGVLEDGSRIMLQSAELDDFAFVGCADLRGRLTQNTVDRVNAALLARATGGVVYLHNGVPVDGASTASAAGSG